MNAISPRSFEAVNGVDSPAPFLCYYNSYLMQTIKRELINLIVSVAIKMRRNQVMIIMTHLNGILCVDITQLSSE